MPRAIHGIFARAVINTYGVESEVSKQSHSGQSLVWGSDVLLLEDYRKKIEGFVELRLLQRIADQMVVYALNIQSSTMMDKVQGDLRSTVFDVIVEKLYEQYPSSIFALIVRDSWGTQVSTILQDAIRTSPSYLFGEALGTTHDYELTNPTEYLMYRAHYDNEPSPVRQLLPRQSRAPWTLAQLQTHIIARLLAGDRIQSDDYVWKLAVDNNLDVQPRDMIDFSARATKISSLDRLGIEGFSARSVLRELIKLSTVHHDHRLDPNREDRSSLDAQLSRLDKTKKLAVDMGWALAEAIQNPDDSAPAERTRWSALVAVDDLTGQGRLNIITHELLLALTQVQSQSPSNRNVAQRRIATDILDKVVPQLLSIDRLPQLKQIMKGLRQAGPLASLAQQQIYEELVALYAGEIPHELLSHEDPAAVRAAVANQYKMRDHCAHLIIFVDLHFR